MTEEEYLKIHKKNLTPLNIKIDTELFEALNRLVKDVDIQKKIGTNCKKMDKPKAAERIVDIIEELIHD